LGLFTLLPSNKASATLQVRKLEVPQLQELESFIEVSTPDDPNAYPTNPAYSNDNSRRISETVKSGDTLSAIFKRAGLSDKHMMELLQSGEEGKRLATLYPGHKLTFALSDENAVQQLEYTIDRLNSYSFTRKDNGFEFSVNERIPDIKLALRSATIEHSLFASGKAANLDDKLVMELANIFGWDVDVAMDIREGDSFKLLFEESFLDGEKIGNGNILAAEFINKSEVYRAVRYV